MSAVAGVVAKAGRETEPAWPADPAALPLERVEAEICTLAGQIAAATSRFLRLLADFDAREGWGGEGICSCAHWLSWRCGLDLRTAREHVRIARALTQLPRVAAAFDQGRVSYSKVRAISRVATPHNENDLLDAALHTPASHLDRLVRGLRTAQRDDDESDRRRRVGVQWRWDDDGNLVVWGRLTADDGAWLLAAMTRVAHRRGDGSAEPFDGPSAGADGSAEPPSRVAGLAGVPPSDIGPALVTAAEMLCTAVEAPVHAPAADVVVHVDAATLVETATISGQDTGQPAPGDGAGDGAGAGAAAPVARPARLDNGPALLHSVLHRLACDGRIQLSVDGPDGRTLDLGHRRRRPNEALFTALWRRDRGCRAPGCGRTRFLHAHHVLAWALGGTTCTDNLILLCGEHHRMLHDGAFSVVALGRQQFRFHGPSGAVRPAAPRMHGDAEGVTAAHPDIGPGTIEPDWDGSALHLHDAVSTYLTGWALDAERRQAADARRP